MGVGYSIAAYPNMSKEELTVRYSEDMQMLIEETMNSLVENKKRFIETSVRKNITDILDKVEGQKGLRDFISRLNSNVEWLNINRPDYNIVDDISSGADLNIVQKMEISSEVLDKVKSCVRYSGLSKSSIIRICSIKELFNRREELSQSDRYKVEDVWIEIDMKLDAANDMLIDSLSYNITKNLIESKMNRGIEIKNLMGMRDAYNKFKQTKGSDIMSKCSKGIELHQIFEDIEEHIEKEV